MTRCPLELVDQDIWTAVQLADMYAKGIPPVAGGALDQSRQFVQAAQFVWRDEEYWRPSALSRLFGD